jgi:phosphoribosyl 1,2-cyclic phosphate phosphodiesterase
VAALDAVIWTHDHADHCHGIDDLRQVFHATGVPIRGFARRDTLEALEQRFNYIFDGRDGYPSIVTGEELPDRLSFGGVTIDVVDQPHGNIHSAGLRFAVDGFSVGYATDFNILTDDMRSLYEGVDVWILDALRYKPHPTHPDVPTALEWIAELRPKRAIFIHMGHSMDYRTVLDALPPGVEPGYDGLEIAG